MVYQLILSVLSLFIACEKGPFGTIVEELLPMGLF